MPCVLRQANALIKGKFGETVIINNLEISEINKFLYIMQIKNVDNFNLQDCERFLNENPNSDLADAVRLRQRQLMDEIFRANERDEEARKAMINS